MQEIKSFFSNLRMKREPPIKRVEVSGDGFVVSKADGISESVRWSQVEGIYTYKVDCYAIDMIWLAFVEKGEKEFHIKEEAEGFEQLMSAVNKAFPEIDGEWYQRVMQPPFAENFTILYLRKQEA